MNPRFRIFARGFSMFGGCATWAGWLSIAWFFGFSAPSSDASEPPRLVVVVSLDQFPYEYLERFGGGFSSEGVFLRLMGEGANFVACNHGQAITVTAPGHSVMLTGTFPNSTGIVDNEWYDRTLNRVVYCVADESHPLVGASPNAEQRGVSPRNLLAPTLGDSLKLARPDSKVFGISIKDRTSVLMTGHAADGAYWFDEFTGNWVTSTYYRDELPQYIRVINESDAAEAYLGKSWTLLHPPEKYREYHPPGRPGKSGRPAKTFPHQMGDKADEKYYKNMTASPFGNEFTLAAARLLLTAEDLGRDDAPDLLAINLSSNDYIGHAYGPHSLEVQDITYRTDLQLAEFVAFIDKHMEGAPWVFALTSDHGVAPIPEYAKRLRLPAERNPLGTPASLRGRLEEKLRGALGTPEEKGRYVLHADDNGVYLNRNLPEVAGDKFTQAQKLVRDVLLAEPSVAAVFMREELLGGDAPQGLALKFQRSFHPQRSGDVLYVLQPYNIAGLSPATHGTPWKYDSHVPLFLWGAGVRSGTFTRQVTPAQLAPTLARLLHVEAPAKCSVEPLEEAIAP